MKAHDVDNIAEDGVEWNPRKGLKARTALNTYLAPSGTWNPRKGLKVNHDFVFHISHFSAVEPEKGIESGKYHKATVALPE